MIRAVNAGLMSGGHGDVMNDTTDIDTTNIHSTVTDTHQTAPGDERDVATSTNPFDSAPFYRKRWMIVVSALFFIPAAIIILLSGPVYQNDGEVWDQKRRVTTALALLCFVIISLSRLAMPAR